MINLEIDPIKKRTCKKNITIKKRSITQNNANEASGLNELDTRSPRQMYLRVRLRGKLTHATEVI